MPLPADWGPDERDVWHSFVTDVTVVPESDELRVAELFQHGLLEHSTYGIADIERQNARHDFFEYFGADEEDWRGDWEAWREYMNY